MAKLKPLAKLLLLGIGVTAVWFGYTTITKNRGTSSTDGSTVTYAPVSGDQGKLKRPLKVAINEWPGFVGGIQANNGLAPNKACTNWNKYGLLVEYHIYNDPAVMMKDYAAGNIDLVWSTIDSATTQLGGLKGSKPTKIVMQVDWSRGGDAIVSHQNVRSIEDLKGKKIALITQSPSESLLQFALANSSLSDSDKKGIVARMVSMDDPDKIVKAFAAGDVDACVTWEPNIHALLNQVKDAKVLLSTETAGNIIGDVFMASTDFINQHPDVIQAFAQGWYDGAFDARNNSNQAVDLMLANMPSFKALGKDQTLDTFTKVKLTDMTDNTKTFGLNGSTPLFDDIYNQANGWYAGEVKTQVTPSEARDTTALRAIYATLSPQDQKPAPIDEYNFSPASRSKAESKSATFTKHLTINFNTGNANLTDDAKIALKEKVKPILELASNAYISIEGNTDSTGNANANQNLSEARAASVVDYLVHLGFKRERFFARGNGSSKPVASNTTSEGRSANRRTDIAVISN